MDSEVCAATSAGDNKQVVSKNDREWKKRLRLRTAVQPSTMQGQDKHGPKEMAEEPVLNTNCSSLRKHPHKAENNQHDRNDSADILRFRCSQCKDNLEFLPKDLTKHFQEIHRGILPVFPCHVCNFSTHELSYLQVHLLSHKDTFSTCSICNDNVQRTLSEFSIHLTMRHSQNGKYSCAMCKKFTTGDVGVFLEHMYLHNLGLEKGGELDISDHSKDFKKQLVAKTTTCMFGCQYCGYEAPQKRQITKHMKTVHGGQNGFQTMNNVEPIRETPNDLLPKKTRRLTRNTVKEMPWMPHDCLSLPGKEFLDKYCSLSDAERTLDETQQFLVRSTSGESGDEKWTKALQSVLSNVPQDMNLLPELDSGIMSSTSKDLAVLTVKNKITVPQHSANHAKRFNMLPPPEKVETVVPESAAVQAHTAADSNRPHSTLNEPHYPKSEITLNNGASLPSSHESEVCSQVCENSENQQMDFEENNKIYDKTVNVNPSEGGVDFPKKQILRNERNEQTCVYKSLPKKKNRKGRRKRKTKPKAFVKGLPAFGLKLVLKKDPVKNKQWMSQSPLTLLGSGLLEDNHRLIQPQTTLEDTPRFLQRALSAESGQKKWTKAPKTDKHNTLEDLKSTSQSADEFLPTSCPETRPQDLSHLNFIAPDCATKPVGFTEVEEATLPAFTRQSPNPGSIVEAVQAVEGDCSSSDGNASQLTLSTNCCSKHVLSPKSGDCFGASGENDKNVACNGSDGIETCSLIDAAMAHKKTGAKSSHALKLLNTPKVKIPCDNPDLTVSSVKCEGLNEMGVSTDHCLELHSIASTSSSQTIQEEPSQSTVYHLQPVPRHVERTLKLVAFTPTQLIRRPFAEQPVVVLNHPDVDIPEVTNIMKVIHRYKGEVQKVVLSRKTLKALLAVDGEIHEANEPRSVPTPSPGLKNLVQERFLLKLKLKRTSRKKYQVVRTVYNCNDLQMRYRCWFCGRAFFNQDTWEAHQQRHLMESKGPNCEESYTG